MKEKIDEVVGKLSARVVKNVVVVAATGYDVFRKPNVGAWELLFGGMAGAVDLEKSFYVGDAAGRRADFDDCDMKFARSIGVRFETPEAFFLHRK